MRKIEEIIIHCSATDLDRFDNIESIRTWHIEKGWSDIGYHYFISKDGTLNFGRKIKTIGAHCRGHNKNSIGICLSGEFYFTKFQFKTCQDLIRNLMHIFNLKEGAIKPHSLYNKNKVCPNFNIKKALPKRGSIEFNIKT